MRKYKSKEKDKMEHKGAWRGRRKSIAAGFFYLFMANSVFFLSFYYSWIVLIIMNSFSSIATEILRLLLLLSPSSFSSAYHGWSSHDDPSAYSLINALSRLHFCEPTRPGKWGFVSFALQQWHLFCVWALTSTRLSYQVAMWKQTYWLKYRRIPR